MHYHVIQEPSCPTFLFSFSMARITFMILGTPELETGTESSLNSQGWQSEQTVDWYPIPSFHLFFSLQISQGENRAKPVNPSGAQACPAAQVSAMFLRCSVSGPLSVSFPVSSPHSMTVRTQELLEVLGQVSFC